MIGNVLVWLGDLVFGSYDKHRRSIDLSVLWPICCQASDTIDQARAAFALHVLGDAAWVRHYSEEELLEFIDNLELVEADR